MITAIKLIFLDIDGVLNSDRSRLAFDRDELLSIAHSTVLTIDSVSVGLLNKLIDATSAKVVISSSHRTMFRSFNSLDKFTLPDLREYFSDLGVKADVIDAIPIIGKATRGEEIDSWMTSFAYNNKDLAIESYVIFDDYEEMLESQAPFYVKTDPAVGIAVVDYWKAYHILCSPLN